MNLPNVREYAKAVMTAQQYMAANQPVPLELQQYIHNVTREAEHLSPRVKQIAMRAVERNIAEMTAEQQSAASEQAVATAIRNATKANFGTSMAGSKLSNGLNPEQLKQLAKGQDVTIKSDRKKFNAAEADAKTRAVTKSIDPKGKGYSLNEWENRLEELAFALRSHDEERFTRLAKAYNADEDTLRDAARNWNRSSMGYHLERHRAEKQSDDDFTIPATDENQRRAEITKNIIEHIPDDYDDGVALSMADAIDPSYLEYDRDEEDVSRRGHIARAMERLEAEEDE